MDGRKKNKGTFGNKGGRKSKSEELQLIEKLTPLEPIAFNALQKGLKEGNTEMVKMYFAYMYGKPKQQVEVSGEANFFKGIDEIEIIVTKK